MHQNQDWWYWNGKPSAEGMAQNWTLDDLEEKHVDHLWGEGSGQVTRVTSTWGQASCVARWSSDL